MVGSQRTVVCDQGALEPVRVFDLGQGDVVAPQIDASEPLAALMADFIDAVTLRSVPRSHIGLGLEVVRLIEEVESELARAPSG